MKKYEYIVSACLAGFSCRYDGKPKPCPEAVKLYEQGRALPLCPETLSGMEVPRPACEWQGDKIHDKSGRDRTASFQKGAELAFAKAIECGCKKAILKSKSPSCGFGRIYDGTFSGALRDGNGIWAQKLADAGFIIYNENNIPKENAENGDSPDKDFDL